MIPDVSSIPSGGEIQVWLAELGKRERKIPLLVSGGNGNRKSSIIFYETLFSLRDIENSA
jgi:hypothetical protein